MTYWPYNITSLVIYFVVNLPGYFAHEVALVVLGEAVAGRDCGEGGGAGDVQVEGPELLLGGAGRQQLGQHRAHSGGQAEVTIGSWGRL